MLGAKTPVTCGGPACSAGTTETKHRGRSLKDFPAAGSVLERQGLEGALSRGGRAVSQPSPNPNFQAVVGGSSETVRPPPWWLCSCECLSLHTATAGLLGPAAVRLFSLSGRRLLTLSKPSLPSLSVSGQMLVGNGFETVYLPCSSELMHPHAYHPVCCGWPRTGPYLQIILAETHHCTQSACRE